MTDERSTILVVSDSTFFIVTIILVLFHGLLSLLSIKKFLAVRNEPEHSAKHLKVIFWFMIACLNITCTLQQFFGWSSIHTNSLLFRFFDEGLAVIFKFLFTSILLNIIFIIQTVIRMAKGNGSTYVDWTNFYLALATLVPLSVFRSGWVVYKVWGSMNGGMFRFYLNNKEGAKKIYINAFSTPFFDVVGPAYDAYAIYEFVVRMMLSTVLGFLLWEVGNLMQTQRSLKAIRKYKLKEWAFFSICYISISLIIVYCGLVLIKRDSDEISWWHMFVYNYTKQKKPEYIPPSSKLIGNGDIIGIVIGLLTTSILTFLTPCRNVVKGK